MKKRILSLFLALVTVFYILPIGVIPAIALGESEETGIEVADMEVGKLYSAKWDYTNSDFIPYCPDSDGESMVWKGYPEIYENEAYVLKNDFPQSLIVKRMEADEEAFVYVTNEDWPEEYNDYRYVDVLELTITGEYIPPADDGYSYGQVNIDCDKAVAGTVYLDEGEKIHAFTSLAIDVSESATYQWQIKLADGRWATITDYIYPYAALSEALTKNAPNGRAEIRCIVTDGYNKYASDTLVVEQKAALVEAYAGANGAPSFKQGIENNVNIAADEGAEGDDETLDSVIFHIQIQYIYRHATNANIDQKNAAGSFGFSMTSGSSYSGTVTCPPVIGYSPYMVYELKAGDIVDGTIIRNYPEGSDEYYKSQSAYVFDEQKEAVEVKIFYLPNKVPYTVKHHEQNLYNDNYAPYKTETLYGYSDSTVGEALYDTEKLANGYTALFYDPGTFITPDGMSTVDIYYDRMYYLVNVDLDGGQGVSPFYVRYETEITLGAPSKLGYTLTDNKWTLTRVYNKDEDDNETDVPQTGWPLAYQNPTPTTTLMIRHNLDYKANWSIASTKYTIIYWLEDANSTEKKYNIWGTVEKTDVTTGDVVDGPAAGDVPTEWTTYNAKVKNKTWTINELNYLTFVKSDQDVVVAGDGSTVVNVYYDRKEYTLKYYYARYNNGNWYVCGQTDASTSFVKTQSDNELKSLGYSNGQFGQVDSKPTLKENVATEKGYTLGEDTSGRYTYYYLSFKAKYGADISDKYPCDIFNTVESLESYNNGWSDRTAIMSAWSGEYNVLFSRSDGNMTMKGKYQVLDYQMLWHPSASYNYSDAESRTVSFLAFWENSIEANWNNPELYRYKIWLPTIKGVNYTQEKVTYGGVEYYLADWYDTCDNSVVGEQTQPVLVGYKDNGWVSYHVAGNTRTDASTTNTLNASESEINEMKELVTAKNPTYSAAVIMNYLYKRQEYQIIYNDNYGNMSSISVPYETPLNVEKYMLPNGPIYPSALEVGQRSFVGWYMDEAGHNAYIFNTTMPAQNVQLYAKWEDLYYQIEVYLDEDQETLATPDANDGTTFPVTVKFGEKITAPAYTSTSEYIFAGWYYKENGVEKRFDFNTMAIKKDYLKSGGENSAIYAKWTSRVPVEYVIYFRLDGTETNIADPVKGESLALMHKTFYARTGAELYAEYRIGYYPKVRSVSMEMDEDESKNVFIFYYTKPSTVEYKVNHTFVDDSFSSILGVNTFSITHTEKITNAASGSASINVSFTKGVSKSAVRAAAQAIKSTVSSTEVDKIWSEIIGLTPDAFQQNLIIETQSGSDNEVTFTWRKIETVGKYQVVFHFQSVDGSAYGYVPQYTIEKMGNYGETYKVEEPPEYVGFKINETMSATALNGAKFENITTDSAGNITGGGLVLNLYYDREIYYYRVKHVLYDDQGSKEELYEIKSARYETIITETASTTDHVNYYLVSEPSQTYTLNSGTQAEPFTIVFNYMIYRVLYYYQVLPLGSGYIEGNNYTETVESGHAPVGATPLPRNDGWIFEGWYKDEAMTIPVTDADATVDSYSHKISPAIPTADKQDMEVRFYAKFIPTKRVFINAGSIDATQAVIYRLQGKNTDNNTKNIDITFVITGTGSITLERLPYGAYTLTVMDWSWRYEDPTIGFNGGTVAGTNGTFDLTLDEVGDVTFTFGAATENKWITDDAYGTVTPTVNP